MQQNAIKAQSRKNTWLYDNYPTPFWRFLAEQALEDFTDHSSLQWLHTMKGEGGLQHQWYAELQEYQYSVIHQLGKLQGHVTRLSHLPKSILLNFNSETLQEYFAATPCPTLECHIQQT